MIIMDSRLEKRKADESDTDFARKIHHAAYHDVVVKQFGNFDEKKQDDFFAKSWQPSKSEIILVDGKDAGYCSIERFSDHIFVEQLAIDPTYQGKGIGTQVLQEVMEEAKAKNLPIKLQVLKENMAQNLYRKLGFREVEQTPTHIRMELDPTTAHHEI